MQALLNDIELDVQELKCLIQSMLTDTNPVLRIVAKRNIHQMQERLDALTKLLDDTFVITPVEHVASDIVEKTTESEVISEPVADVPVEATHVSDIAVPASQILAERIKPATDLQHAISLNDSFRFTRELFAGDATRMNEVVRLCGGASSLDEAMSVFMSTVQPDEENEAAADFIELLKKYFMTFRAIRILKEADLVLAEDTRTSGILLKHFEIKNAMQSHHKFNEHKTVESVVNRIKGGETVALISDAGTPGISDPGFLVVRECVRNGIEVQCLPGATAFVPALVASGLPNEKFCFEGFLPQKKGRMTRLKGLAEERRTMVFYESPHRLVKALTQFAEYFGSERQASVSREISKIHEETVRGTLTELIEHFTANEPRGEIVIVVAGIDD